MDNISSYPLQWPPQQPRTRASDRKHGSFGVRESSTYSSYKQLKSITLHEAVERVDAELGKFTKVGQRHRVDEENVVYSSNIPARNDGRPKSGFAKPEDPGVAVYFILDGARRCIACDTYARLEDNVAAVAHTLEALRAIERHGSQMFHTAMAGFNALPAPNDYPNMDWRIILDYGGSNFDEARRQYRRKASLTHPDNGGTDEAFDRVQKAWERAQLELK
jgi:hypothetical protein